MSDSVASHNEDDASVVLQVEDLTVDFDVRGRVVNILSAVNFQVRRGETLGIIGESG